MSPVAVAFVIVNVVALLALPRRWAPLPLLTGACYMTMGQGIELGSFSFTVVRILVAAGIVRVILRRERLVGGPKFVDWLIFVWALWACIASVFHTDPALGLTYRLGLVYTACGIYFLLRIFCQSFDDVRHLCRLAALLLVPVAAEMVYEHIASHNLFSMFGGVNSVPLVREGKLRASGPFAHPILAGSVGAASLPLMFGLWATNRNSALLGMIACVTMVLASSSSGPIMSTAAALAALCLWTQHGRMRALRWLAMATYIGLEIVMEAPAYYLMGRIDFTGGSTGWHRARLIESAFAHLNEWWLGGTDYTRHWMPTGVSWSPNHTDITNQYLRFGVVGGLPLMVGFIVMLAKSFGFIGKTLRVDGLSRNERFLVWTLGAALFAHAATSVSVTYFDQSVVFLYFTFAAIGSTWSAALALQGRAATQRLSDAAQPRTPLRAPSRTLNVRGVGPATTNSC